MSVRMMARVWDSGIEDRSELLVMLALADFCDDDGKCWPSMARIAEKARTTERGAQKIVRRLEACGWLSVDTGNGRGGCNRYTLNPERETPNAVPPNAVHPEHGDTKPRTGVQKTPNGGSPEPSGTVKNRHKDSTDVESVETAAVASAVDAYNEVAERVGWAKVQKVTAARSAALKARLREAGGTDGWMTALAKAEASDFLSGRNDRGWAASFDFLTRQSSFAKLMEGVYDNRAPAGPQRRSAADERHEAHARAVERFRRERGLDSGESGDGTVALFPARPALSGQ